MWCLTSLLVLACVKHRQRQALWIPVWFCLVSFCTPSIVYDCTTVQSRFLWHIINVERRHPLTVPTQTTRYRNNWTLFAKRKALLIETGYIYQDLFAWSLMIFEALECGKPLWGQACSIPKSMHAGVLPSKTSHGLKSCLHSYKAQISNQPSSSRWVWGFTVLLIQTPWRLCYFLFCSCGRHPFLQVLGQQCTASKTLTHLSCLQAFIFWPFLPV